LKINALPDVFYKRYGHIPTNIYIRQCYRRLYEINSELMLTYTKPFPTTLFTGAPEIGKSMFLIYFVLFLHDPRFNDKRFAVEFFDKREYHYFQPSIECSGLSCSIEIKDSFPMLEVSIFSDTAHLLEPCCRGKWLFIFSSPNPMRFKEARKTLQSLYIPFQLGIILELKFIEPNDSNWIARFIIFGGIPKSVFWDGIEDKGFGSNRWSHR
jgi:hypothetical protein